MSYLPKPTFCMPKYGGKIGTNVEWGRGEQGEASLGGPYFTKMTVHPPDEGAYVDMEGRYGGITVDGEPACLAALHPNSVVVGTAMSLWYRLELLKLLIHSNFSFAIDFSLCFCMTHFCSSCRDLYLVFHLNNFKLSQLNF